MMNLPSPIDRVLFRGREFYIKRDDLIDRDFSGNKARKFQYWLNREFPDIKKIVSYGSSQSNAMYSLSVLAKMRGWSFEYYVDHTPSWLKNNPVGNYKGALENGAIFKEEPLPDTFGTDTLFIEEGGRQKESEEGIYLLAKEIFDWYIDNKIEKLSIFLPSGTGTTALYLSKHIKKFSDNKIEVITTPCVGGSEYLLEQFEELEKDTRVYPTIWNLSKHYSFGRLYREFYEIWIELKENTKVEFDLLYDPKGWLVLMDRVEQIDGNILYIHQGGLLGNISMADRYKRKFPNIKER